MCRDRHGVARSRSQLNSIDATRESVERVAEEVASVVLAGGVVIFPTDTVYGIGCDLMSQASVERIFTLKGRPAEKPLSLHMGSVEELLEYVPDDARVKQIAKHFLPGPLTILIKRPGWVGTYVNAGLPALGLRVPDHALCSAILERCGPLAATSANRSGEPAFTGEGNLESLPQADLFVDAGPTPLRAESTIVDLSGEHARFIREGALRAADLFPYLRLHGESS